MNNRLGRNPFGSPQSSRTGKTQSRATDEVKAALAGETAAGPYASAEVYVPTLLQSLIEFPARVVLVGIRVLGFGASFF